MAIRTLFEHAVILAILGLLVFICLRQLWYRRKIRTILARHSVEMPTLEALNASLTVLNTESPKYMFTAKERANVPFRGRVVSFVYGLVGSAYPRNVRGWWSIGKSFYAVSDLNQSDWMTRNPDVFVPASKGQSCCVFWVKVGNLNFEGPIPQSFLSLRMTTKVPSPQDGCPLFQVPRRFQWNAGTSGRPWKARVWALRPGNTGF